MKKETFAAVATLATMMFMSRGAMAQDQPDRSSSSSSGQSSQQDQSGSARQAGSRAGQGGPEPEHGPEIRRVRVDE